MGKHAAMACCAVLGLGIVLVARPSANGMCDDARSGATEELARFQGVWRLVYEEWNGERTPGKEVTPIWIEFRGDRQSVHHDDECLVAEIPVVIDPKATPRALDRKIVDGPNAGKTVLGVYEIERETLITCTAEAGRERPSEFTATSGSGRTLRVFLKSKPSESPKEKAIREDLARFGGTWVFQELVISGEVISHTGLIGNRMHLKGDRFDSEAVPRSSTGYIKIDPSQTPKTMDIIFLGGDRKGSTLLGIYELSDSSYRLCTSRPGEPRPTSFESTAENRQAVQIMVRE